MVIIPFHDTNFNSEEIPRIRFAGSYGRMVEELGVLKRYTKLPRLRK
jgi:hypothetical protein